MKHEHIVKAKDGPLEKAVYVGAVIEPVMTLPQIYDTWTDPASGGSILTWSAYFLFALVWLAYALKYRIRPLIITELLWVVFQGLVVVGLLVRH